MTPSRLPIGIQTFRDIREGGYRYVDKTPFIRRMLDEGRYYFLSRPRRFGKSLLLDTIAELFLGSEELFRGLAIHGHWDWSVRRPVIRLGFHGGPYTDPGAVAAGAMQQMDVAECRYGLDSRYATAPERFADLISQLHRSTGRRPVVLVDEYDKPILDALSDPETALANRDFLRGLYGTIKGSQAHVRFSLLTGVSKFSKVNLFSGLNNLLDITIDPVYSSVCGYSEDDLDTVFAEDMRGLDRERVRRWYDGYSWRGDERVYNPFDILLLLQKREFRPYWFETGTPTFLVDMLAESGTAPLDLEDMVASERLLSAFDVDHIGTEALLFQTGYLTIREAVGAGGRIRYRLSYPNQEVRRALSEVLLPHLIAASDLDALRGTDEMAAALTAGDTEALREILNRVFAGIPHQWHSRSRVARHEAWYASVVYAFLASLGTHLTVEDSGSGGRADIAVRVAGRIYIFEFKVVDGEAEGRALAQIRDRGYADKYRGLGEPIHLVGIEFSRATRNIAGFEAEVV